jgi:hypothetical protein
VQPGGALAKQHRNAVAADISSGSSTTKVAPCGVSASLKVPPLRSASSRAIARPWPLPPVVERPPRNKRERTAAGTPGAVVRDGDLRHRAGAREGHADGAQRTGPARDRRGVVQQIKENPEHVLRIGHHRRRVLRIGLERDRGGQVEAISSRTCATVRATSKLAREAGPPSACFAAPLHMAATRASKACVDATVRPLCGFAGHSSVST